MSLTWTSRKLETWIFIKVPLRGPPLTTWCYLSRKFTPSSRITGKMQTIYRENYLIWMPCGSRCSSRVFLWNCSSTELTIIETKLNKYYRFVLGFTYNKQIGKCIWQYYIGFYQRSARKWTMRTPKNVHTEKYVQSKILGHQSLLRDIILLETVFLRVQGCFDKPQASLAI